MRARALQSLPPSLAKAAYLALRSARQNQILSALMKSAEARLGAAGAASLPPNGAVRASSALVGIAALIAILTLGLYISSSIDAVVLIVLAVLAVVGVFSLFGLLAGYIRIGDGPVSAALLSAANDGVETAVEIVRADGTIAHANRQALAWRETGYNSIADLLNARPQTADALYRLSTAADRGEPRSEVVVLQVGRAKGTAASERWVRVSVAPAGHVPGYTTQGLTLWQMLDISADRRREQQAVGQLASALSYFDTMPVGIVAVAPDGSVAHANATLRRWLGTTTSARSAASTLGDMIALDGAALVREAMSRDDGRSATFDLDLLREDGTTRPVQALLRPSNRRDGNNHATLVLFERQADAVAAPALAEDRFARIFNTAPFGVATIDKAGVVLSSNAAFARLFPTSGRSLETVLARIFPDGRGEVRDEVAAAVDRALAGRAGGSPIEVASGADGKVACRVYVHPLTVGQDTREAAIVYVADASEQKALELKFAQSQKMEAVGKLAGGIAHDFNNVLTVIIGLSDLLLQVRRPTDPGYNDISQIRNNANRAAGMVRQLLAFSRKQTLEPEVLSVNDVIQDFAFTLTKMIGERVDLKHQPGRDLWSVKADKTQFGQVLFNLAVNARDAMPNGGKLRIRTKNVSERESLKRGAQGMPAAEYVMMEVEDTGTGMPAEVMAKIFDPFFTTKEVGKGTGLGLSTVYGIVKQTGGFIFVDSKVGEGTTFQIYLPRHIPKADEIEQAAARKKEPARDLTGTGRVLLVEDEDGVRGFAVRALTRQGYEVLEASSGIEALDVLAEAQGKIDIVVSDVIMPEMDGPTMYKEMLKTNPGLKIIFVSGYPSDAFEKSLDPDTHFGFLPKPFTLPQLAAKVKEELAR